MLGILALLVGMTLSVGAVPSAGPVPLEEYEPAVGTAILVDTQGAVLYLINPDGAYTTAPVLLGQNRTVRYLGRTYKATTPEAHWTMRTIHTQGDRLTFGKEGTFLRLYKEGSQYTSYGIHTHRYFERMLDEGNPYRSMGCILVAKDVLDKIQRAWELNDRSLTVVTTYGLPSAPPLQRNIADSPAPETSGGKRTDMRG